MKKIIIIIMSIILITGCSNSKTDEKNAKVNNNENITKEQVIGNYSVSNASLVYDKGTSIFKITITNITNSPLNINDFKITFKSESGSVITVLNGFSIDDMEPNVGLEISLDSDVDLSDAASVEYEIN